MFKQSTIKNVWAKGMGMAPGKLRYMAFIIVRFQVKTLSPNIEDVQFGLKNKNANKRDN